jgi:hypothetical protein
MCCKNDVCRIIRQFSKHDSSRSETEDIPVLNNFFEGVRPNFLHPGTAIAESAFKNMGMEVGKLAKIHCWTAPRLSHTVYLFILLRIGASGLTETFRRTTRGRLFVTLLLPLMTHEFL